MKKTNKIIITVVVVAVLLLGIGYAAIQNITLNITGTAAADPSQANFKVMFSGTPTVSDDTYVTATITDDTNTTINVDGLTKKGDIVTATYTVQNASEDLSADLAVSTTNNNTEFFTLSSEIAQTSLVAGEETTLVVTVELTKTPITDSVSTTIGVQLEAMPVQPGEEGTSEGINGSSQTPSGINEYGFYFDKFYANQDEGFGFIAHEDGSAEMFAYILSGEIEGLESDEWMCMDYLSAGEVDFNEMITDGVTISKEGKTINIDGVDFGISDVDLHGFYYGCEYFIEIDDNREAILEIKENGTVQLTSYENGEIVEDIVEENFLIPIANGYLMTYDDQLVLSVNPSGEVVAFAIVEGVFTLKEKHNYVSEVTKEVTCSEDGEMKNTCLDCNKTYTVTIIAPNHPNDVDNDGVCDDCGETITYTEIEVESYNREKFGYSDSTSELVIQSTLYEERTRTWYKVTKIGSSAFENCTNLTSVVIPEGVTTIEASAFEDCTNLTNIVIPEGVKSISSDAFRSCTNLTNIVLPTTISSISSYAFRFCTSLTEINIPQSLESIDGLAFSNCTALTKITVDSNNPNYCSKDNILYTKDMTILVKYPNAKTDKIFEIPDTVKIIDEGAFESCKNLTNVIIPNSVTDIETYAFMYCINLTNLTIPGSVETIGYGSFADCTSLTDVVIHHGVKNIAYIAFEYCDNLTTIVIPDSVTSIGDRAFYLCYKLTTVNYTGTEEQWDAIQIKNDNTYLTNATINYNYVMPTE